MKVSRQWIQDYVTFDLPAGEDLAVKIGSQLGEVETVEALGKKYGAALIVKVVSCEKIENSDHLNICLIDDGHVKADVERNDDGYIQVVCGAPNVRAGITVVWLPPGATVPETYDKEPFVLSARPLRGVVSNGMLASARELALGEDHDGILIIHQQADAGTEFKDLFKLDDTIIDIENKMFTHRPDCFGQLGVAREVAGIYGKQFVSPDWYTNTPTFSPANGLDLAVTNDLADEVPRFMAVALKEVVIQPSPVWLQTYLARVGLKPINNVVDITNYLMMLTGQPLHAFDYDKVAALTSQKGAHITVRRPKKGEQIALLNGKTITPRPEAIMIASGNHLIGVGGIMGGADTEITKDTVNIILECATFDMYSVRRTSMAHGLFTDAVTRFNKGQSPHQNDRVIAEAMRMLAETAGAVQASQVFDEKAELPIANGITVSPDFINSRLGLSLSAAEIVTLLANVEFETYEMDNLNQIFALAPFWRTDITIPEDLVEEVGRLYGYDQLPLTLPRRDIMPAHRDELLHIKQQLRDSLVRAGGNEVLTYSFVAKGLLEKAGQDPASAFELGNALSPELQSLRISLLPSLLDKVQPNVKAGYNQFMLFEIGKGHILTHQNDDEDGLPSEFNFVSAVYTNAKADSHAGAAYYQVRHVVENLAKDLGADLTFKPIVDMPDQAILKPYEPTRSAFIYVTETDELIGIVGELSAKTRANFKLSETTAGFDIDINDLLQAPKLKTKYQQLPKFPKIEQDITLRVGLDVHYQDILDVIQQTVVKQLTLPTLASINCLGIYQGEGAVVKQITVRLSLASYEKTMVDAEVTKLLDAVTIAANQTYGAERV